MHSQSQAGTAATHLPVTALLCLFCFASYCLDASARGPRTAAIQRRRVGKRKAQRLACFGLWPASLLSEFRAHVLPHGRTGSRARHARGAFLLRLLSSLPGHWADGTDSYPWTGVPGPFLIESLVFTYASAFAKKKTYASAPVPDNFYPVPFAIAAKYRLHKGRRIWHI